MKFKFKFKKTDKTGTILIIMLIIGLSLLLYPSVANFWNQRTQSNVISSYEESLKEMEKEDFTKLFDDAKAYNKKLLDVSNALAHYDRIPGYNDLLKVNNSGAMGYITIDKIKVELPIYHGTSEEVLNVAVGHLQGSSLPIGGKGVHTVLTGHRGLPSATLFTDLNKLEVGDTFTITVLDQTITYEVDQVRIVLPKEVDELKIDPDKDYCTLVTCTPYGLNTHRMLVRGVRTSNLKNKPLLYIKNDCDQINPLIVTPALAIPMLVVLLIVVFTRDKKKRDARKKLNQENQKQSETE
ncbi:MAG: class C sortase [Erysipelotrichaceae bacterium]|nr:class C sortase [Erysipelotrichaceae bacterium]